MLVKLDNNSLLNIDHVQRIVISAETRERNAFRIIFYLSGDKEVVLKGFANIDEAQSMLNRIYEHVNKP